MLVGEKKARLFAAFQELQTAINHLGIKDYSLGEDLDEALRRINNAIFLIISVQREDWLYRIPEDEVCNDKEKATN